MTKAQSRTSKTFRRSPQSRRKASIAMLGAVLGLAAACDDVPPPTAPDSEPSFARGGSRIAGAVYTMTNATHHNEVLVYPRFADGTIGSPAAVPTGGAGSGGGLGSQGAVVLSDDGRWLLAVNAGSNELSVFSARRAHVSLRDRIGSGGAMPVSVATHGGLIYVLNAGTPNNVTGFRLNSRGQLAKIPGSSRGLSAESTGPAQVSFVNNGSTLVVTEKGTNTITTFPVDHHTGLLGSANFVASEGETPFGFAVDQQGRLFVSEAFGGAPGASALSSYASGSFAPISSSVGSGEQAACWVVLARHRAYVTNTASGSVSSYAVANDGSVTLEHAVAASTGAGSGPIDMAVSRNGQFVFVLAPGNGTVRPYLINADGTLAGLGPISGVPSTAFGLAAY